MSKLLNFQYYLVNKSCKNKGLTLVHSHVHELEVLFVEYRRQESVALLNVCGCILKTKICSYQPCKKKAKSDCLPDSTVQAASCHARHAYNGAPPWARCCWSGSSTWPRHSPNSYPLKKKSKISNHRSNFSNSEFTVAIGSCAIEVTYGGRQGGVVEQHPPGIRAVPHARMVRVAVVVQGVVVVVVAEGMRHPARIVRIGEA